MAGDINLQPFIDQLFGNGASTGAPAGDMGERMSSRPADWQQSLMQSVDPETQKKERIRNFLSTFGNALSSTPGNFLQGLAAGANKGAAVYNQQRGDDADKRIAAQRLIQEFTEKQQDRNTERTTNKLNTARQLNKDNQADEDRIYNRGRQEKLDELAVRRVDIADRRADADAKKLNAKVAKNGGGGPLTEWQQTQTRTALENMVTKFNDSLGEALDEEEQAANEAAVTAYRTKLYTLQNFDPQSGDYLGAPAAAPGVLPVPQAPNEEGKTSLPVPATAGPPPLASRIVGQVYESPAGPVIWTGKGWKKAQ